MTGERSGDGDPDDHERADDTADPPVDPDPSGPDPPADPDPASDDEEPLETPKSPGTEPTRDGITESAEGSGEPPEFTREDRPLEPYHFTHEVPHPDDPRSFGPVRSFARERPDLFEPLQRWLNQAQFGTSYDRYVPRCVRAAIVGAVVGVVVGIAVALLYSGGMDLVASTGLTILGALGGAILGAAIGGAGRLLHPLIVAQREARHIRVGLPHAIIFLYALSHGGINLYESAQRLADAEDTYGPIAAGFRRIIQDTRLFDRDLFTALVAARNLTPADEFAIFLDELVNVLETGGDVGSFLQSEAESNLEAAEERQEELLDDMDTLAEVYIVIIFAGPVFLIVVLLVMSFIASRVMVAMHALVYVLVPIAIIGFLVVFWWIMEPYRQHIGAPSTTEVVTWNESEEAGEMPDDQRLEAYETTQQLPLLHRLVHGPVSTLRERPSSVLYATVPIGLLVALATWLTVPRSAPIRSAAGIIAIPFLISGIPYGALYDLKRRRQRAVRKRFPDALEVVAEGVDNDVPLADCFRLVAERTGGELATELHRAHLDVTWTNDVAGALARFADRMGVPQVTRTVRLLSESVRATDDLGPIFRLVADDLDRRNTIRRERHHQMQPYIIIVFLGVIVYLAIIAMFDSFFLPVVAERAAAVTTPARNTAIEIDPAPISTYRRLFFHSALIQAIGNGLLLGKLLDNRLRTGVGYASVLVTIVLITFVALL